jgi:hypothetical protein
LNFKILLGITAILGLITVSIVAAAPIQAYINQTANGDVLKTQDQDRLRTRDCDCTCSGTRNENPMRLRLQECMSKGVREERAIAGAGLDVFEVEPKVQ